MESILCFVARWVSDKDMKALQSACMRTSTMTREQQDEELPTALDDQVLYSSAPLVFFVLSPCVSQSSVRVSIAGDAECPLSTLPVKKKVVRYMFVMLSSTFFRILYFFLTEVRTERRTERETGIRHLK